MIYVCRDYMQYCNGLEKSGLVTNMSKRWEPPQRECILQLYFMYQAQNGSKLEDTHLCTL